jgi:methylmalonyl-CoA/ethylmalonyl-CoA epimerase
VETNDKPYKLHHVGFVVNSIEASATGLTGTLGARWSGEIFADPHQKVRVTFLMLLPGDAQIELVEPNAEDAPVSRFLIEKGPGLHHLCYEVDDLETAIAAMRSKGGMIARPPKPAVAFGGRRIAWILSAEKLLIELLETGQTQHVAITGS